MKTLAQASLLALLLAPTSACDINVLVPKTAGDSGVPSAKVVVSLGLTGLEGLPADVEDVQVRVVDVLLHHKGDDGWLVASNEEVVLDLADGPGSVSFPQLPVMLGSYDAIQVQIGGMVVQDGDGWAGAELATYELEFNRVIDIQADTTIQLNLDLSRGVVRSGPRWEADLALGIDLLRGI